MDILEPPGQEYLLLNIVKVTVWSGMVQLEGSPQPELLPLFLKRPVSSNSEEYVTGVLLGELEFEGPEASLPTDEATLQETVGDHMVEHQGLPEMDVWALHQFDVIYELLHLLGLSGLDVRTLLVGFGLVVDLEGGLGKDTEELLAACALDGAISEEDITVGEPFTEQDTLDLALGVLRVGQHTVDSYHISILHDVLGHSNYALYFIQIQFSLSDLA